MATIHATIIPTASESALCESIRHDFDLRIPYYCEENVWRLAYRKLHHRTQIDNISNERFYVAFISNPQKCVPMYHQRAATTAGAVKGEQPCCFWDYHVILLGTTDADGSNNCDCDDADNTKSKRILVYDMDTTIVPYPVPLQGYVSLSFQLDDGPRNNIHSRDARYEPYFRIIPAETYIKYFTSDRSHMYNTKTQSYNKPPPPYRCIVASNMITDAPTIIPSTNMKESVRGANQGDMCHDSQKNNIESNFLKYVDFTSSLRGENNYAPSINRYGTIVTLEQLIRHDF